MKLETAIQFIVDHTGRNEKRELQPVFESSVDRICRALEYDDIQIDDLLHILYTQNRTAFYCIGTYFSVMAGETNAPDIFEDVDQKWWDAEIREWISAMISNMDPGDRNAIVDSLREIGAHSLH